MQDIHELIFSLVLLLSFFFYFVFLSSQCVHIVLFTWSVKTHVKMHSESVIKINIHDKSAKKIDIYSRSVKESARKDLRMSFRKTFLNCLINMLLLSRRLLYTSILQRKSLLEEIWEWLLKRLFQTTYDASADLIQWDI